MAPTGTTSSGMAMLYTVRGVSAPDSSPICVAARVSSTRVGTIPTWPVPGSVYPSTSTITCAAAFESLCNEIVPSSPSATTVEFALSIPGA